MTDLTGNDPADADPCATTKRPLFAQPWFYLIYLVFYFVPWLFEAPRLIDIAAAAVAIAVFLPVYFRVFEENTLKYVPLIFAIEAIGLLVAPFHGMYGSFHVYAMAQSGYQRPRRNAFALLVFLTAVYAGVSFLLGTHWVEIVIVTFMGAVIGAGCIASAEQIEHGRLMERSRALDRRMATVAERERIARDLHDVLGHTLTMVTLKAEVAVRLIDKDPERARREMEEIRDAGRQALKDVRATVSDMGSTTLEIELAAASDALDSAGVKLSLDGEIPQLDPDVSRTLGLALREAVTNIIRHAGAREATIRFARQDGEFSLLVEDDGDGTTGPEGSGLRGLRERLESLGGSLERGVSGQGGTRLLFHLPAGSVA